MLGLRKSFRFCTLSFSRTGIFFCLCFFNKLVILDCNSGLHCLEGASGRLTRGGRWDFVGLSVVGALVSGESLLNRDVPSMSS